MISFILAGTILFVTFVISGVLALVGAPGSVLQGSSNRVMICGGGLALFVAATHWI